MDESTGTRMGIRDKSVVHIFYPAERCTALFMGVSVAGAYCTTADILADGELCAHRSFDRGALFLVA